MAQRSAAGLRDTFRGTCAGRQIQTLGDIRRRNLFNIPSFIKGDHSPNDGTRCTILLRCLELVDSSYLHNEIPQSNHKLANGDMICIDPWSIRKHYTSASNAVME